MRERLDIARETYGAERDAGQGRVSAGLAALRAAAAKERAGRAGPENMRERLKDVLNTPRDELEIEDEQDREKDREVENEREIDREIDRDPGLSN